MKLGEVYTSPWGRYVVHRTAPVVLRSLDRFGAFIVDPSPGDYALAQSARIEVTVSSSRLLEDLSTARIKLGPGAEPHLGPWHPDVNALRAAGLPAWRPCLTRARGDGDEVLAREHAWFLEDGDGGSLYCHTCRASRPRSVMGPRAWVVRIREALKVGDIAQAHELVQLGPSSAPVATPNIRPLLVVDKTPSAEPIGAQNIRAVPAPVGQRDLNPANVQHTWSAEITIVCESVKRGCEFRALFYDRATQQFYGGGGATPFEAIAWCFDEYIARVVHGMPVSPARKASDTPGSRFPAALAARKAA